MVKETTFTYVPESPEKLVSNIALIVKMERRRVTVSMKLLAKVLYCNHEHLCEMLGIPFPRARFVTALVQQKIGMVKCNAEYVSFESDVAGEFTTVAGFWTFLKLCTEREYDS